jgi:diguanylate cyclase (GGDEF)-like protein
MSEGNTEINHSPKPSSSEDKSSSSNSSSSGKFGRLRELVKQQQEAAQTNFRRDTKREEPKSSFLGIAIDKVRADLAAEYDKKTGLRNHESFYNEAEREIAKVNRNPHLHGLILGIQDIDNFGAFNSTYGELTGDQALKKVASALTSSIRDTDLAGRWGGEEFAFALPYDKENSADTPEAFAATRQTTDLTPPGERMRKQVEDIPVNSEIPQKLTVSIGMSEFVPGETFTHCFERASTASLIAKLTNKNRAVIAKLDNNNEWYYHDVTNNIIYKAVMSEDNKKLESLQDITQNISYLVDYKGDKKPKLVNVAA